MAKIHNGYINQNLKNTFKDTGLNNFDLATTRLYKGVKPMWEQLGFENNSFDVPEEHIYWQNIIPSNCDFSNLTGVSVQLESTIINDVDMVYFVATIDGDVEQEWEGGFHYPILPPVNKNGNFEGELDTETSYGNSSAPVANLNAVDDNLILDIDFEQTTTDDLSDKTEINNIEYSKDFQLSLDEDFRLKTDTFQIPDGVERELFEQAF